jgi:hypothetical protein
MIAAPPGRKEERLIMDIFSLIFSVFIIMPIGILLWRLAIYDSKVECFFKKSKLKKGG